MLAYLPTPPAYHAPEEPQPTESAVPAQRQVPDLTTTDGTEYQFVDLLPMVDYAEDFIEAPRRREMNSPERGQFRAFLRALHPHCTYCGRPINGKGTLDHLVPRCRGGRNVVENLVLSCGNCNSSKGGRDLEAWLARLDKIRANVAKLIADRLEGGAA